MKEDNSEQDFLAKARRTLDKGCENLEAQTRNRLRRARMAALDEAKSRADRRWPRLLAPLAATLAIVLVVAALFLRNGPALPPTNGEAVADLEILTAAESPEFYSEIDFYLWLAEGEQHAG